MRRRNLWLLGAGLAGAAAIAAALHFRPREDSPGFAPGELLFPSLAERLPAVAEVSIRRHEGGVLIRRTAEGWVLPERDGFPIREARLRELLTGLTELRVIEPRARDPEGWARLGVDDPATPGSTAALLTLSDAAGRPMLELLVGRRRVRTLASVPESVYVRRPQEAQSWLAEGRLIVEADAASWMDRDIVDLPPERLLSVEIRRRDAPAPLSLARPAPGAPLALTGMDHPPELDAGALEEVLRGFERLTLLDAVPAERMPGELQGEAQFRFDGGLTVRVELSRLEQFVWIRLTAEGGGSEGERLAARWRPWAYQVGNWKERAFLPSLADLTGAR
ncbi:MAG: DUF4340 domain-containing protein [Rhodovarius sp.]|nr:DUF4340 domain-containing protein [Rhodovarius sp.]